MNRRPEAAEGRAHRDDDRHRTATVAATIRHRDRGNPSPRQSATAAIRVRGNPRPRQSVTAAIRDRDSGRRPHPDREQAIGERFAESDLIGIPTTVVLGNHYADPDEVKLEARDGATRHPDIDDAVAELRGATDGT